jgi:L-alanine-DL-glutamate epimerase-like enolase superfamily enzyme
MQPQTGADPTVTAVTSSVHRIPLETPEADGTLMWDATTVVVVEATGGGERGIGYTFGPAACGSLIGEMLAGVAVGRSALDPPGAWDAMVRAVRNAGRPGIASMAIAAMDVALWDLKGRILGRSVSDLIGSLRTEVPVYGSGGFVSMSDDELVRQLQGWVEDLGCRAVKIKIGEAWGTSERRDLERTEVARRAIGEATGLFVDANGGYERKQAIRMAERLRDLDVAWFEEPVSSDDLDGLRMVAEAVTPDVAAGEYGYDLVYFERMCAARAIDCLQADVSRCAGITEWLRVAAVAAAHGLEISGHTAQSLHLHAATAVPNLRHLEYFADHARAERLLFDGVPDVKDGVLRTDPSRPGIGLLLKRSEAEEVRVA